MTYVTQSVAGLGQSTQNAPGGTVTGAIGTNTRPAGGSTGTSWVGDLATLIGAGTQGASAIITAARSGPASITAPGSTFTSPWDASALPPPAASGGGGSRSKMLYVAAGVAIVAAIGFIGFKAMGASKEKNPRLSGQRLGAAMHHWHSSMGDPIYAVGSVLYAGMQPDADSLQEALSAIQRLKSQAESGAWGWGRRDVRELAAIERGLTHLL